MRKDRVYRFNECEYVVLGFSKIKNGQTGLWGDAVNYKRTAEFDETVYVEEKNEFLSKFIPKELEVGDEVIIFAMGRVVGVTTVTIVEDGKCGINGNLPCCHFDLPTKVLSGGHIATFGNYGYAYHTIK